MRSLGIVAGQSFDQSGGEAPAATPSRMIHTVYASTTQGNEDILIYEPEGLGDTPGKTYPLHICLGGDGSMGSFLTRTGLVLTHAGGNLYTGTIDNPTLTGGRKAFYGSIVAYVDGVEVARCRRAMDGTNANFYSTGAIPGITGTVAVATYPDSPINLQFPSAPGGTVTLDYEMSKIFEAGLPRFLNNGLYEWPNMIVVMVQKGASGTFYGVQDHYLDPKAYMLANYPMIDEDRISASGISRGGVFLEALSQSAYAGELAAYLQLSGLAFSPTSWASFSDKGVMIIGGQDENADGYSTACGTVLNTTGAITTLHNYPGSIMVENAQHTGTVWDTNCFIISSALFDFRDWIDVWSIDYEKQATLHVEKAEAKVDIDRWREAKRAVYFMTAGAVKTDLENRLATLKTTIDNGKKRWYFDFGTTTDTETYLNMNHLNTNFQAGTSYSSLKDDNNNVTGVGLTVVTQLATSPTNRFATTTRGANPQFGFTQANYSDGLNCHITETGGQFKITGLDTGKTYRVKFYLGNGSTSKDHNMSLRFTIGGVVQNPFLTYQNRVTPTYNNVAPNGSGEIVISVYADGDTTTLINLMQLEEQ